MASPVLSTLHHVTERKLNKLATQREKFEADKDAILEKVASAPDQRSKVQVLLDGFELYGITPRQPELFIANIERFIQQSKHDPSVSSTQLQEWQAKLENELEISSAKYEYASLFGKLVIEWIKHPNPAASASGPSPVGSDTDSETSDSFNYVGRKEMHEQRKEWESHAFTEKKLDQNKIEEYLNEIFGTVSQAKKIKKSPLQNLRDTIKTVMDFKSELHNPSQRRTSHANYRFTVDNLKSSILGVLQSDLLAGSKREALAGLDTQPTVLEELVDVLNMDLEDLDRWEWDPTPIPLTMRRQLNGKYRVYMDEETHQAILLHFIGKTWTVALKNAFVTFHHSGAWQQSPYQSMGKRARQMRDHYMPHSSHQTQTVRNHRRTKYQEDYFMTQLPNENNDDGQDYSLEDQKDDWEADRGATAENSAKRSPVETKQALLRLVTTEMILNTKVYNEFTVFQSDFKWFGPSLSHEAIFSVLKFLGIPPKWLNFFKKFLEAPVVFPQDGPDAEVHVRKCGIPMSHVLSDALSEAVLFCLDFAVNKRTQGANIYRFHDDLWFWGQEKTCITAWNAIQEFTQIMGLELNQEKTGTALIVANKANARSPAAVLPQGKIKWGFLVLDAEAGHWVVDRADVDRHIVELRRQMGACRSIMAWVQA